MSVAIKTSPLGGISNRGRTHGAWKRKTSDDEDERKGDVKRTKYSWYVTLESESPSPTDEDEESIYTVQGDETEYAKDTTDTSSTRSCTSSDESESDDAYHMEYELDSAPENENPFLELSSSSEPEDFLEVEILSIYESEGLADDSDLSRGSLDSDFTRADFRTCVQCKKVNTNPLYRYCRSCYQVKKTNFPRSKPKKRSKELIIGSQQSSLQFEFLRKELVTTKKHGYLQQHHHDNNPNTMARLLSLQGSTAPSSQELFEMDSGVASITCDLDSGVASSQDLESMAADLRTSSRMSHRDEVDSGHAPTEGDSDHSYAPSEGSTGMNLTKDKILDLHLSSETKMSRPMNPLVKKIQQRHYRDSANDSGSSGINSANATTDAPKGASTSISEGEFSSSVTNYQSHTCVERMEGQKNSVHHTSLDDQKSSICQTCMENQKNSVFVHGRSCHRYCCYKCAKRVLISSNNRCPMCNQRVTQTLKFYQ